MKVRDLSNKLLKSNIAGDYGIEVEVEGYNLPNLNNKYWKAVHDRSLRGECYEYITNGAIAFEEVRKVMTYLNAKFKERGSELHLSFRTSVHIHMNVLDVEMEKLLTIIYLYYLFEEPLVGFCGDSRVGNRFCLRLTDAESIVDNIQYAFGNNGVNLTRMNNEKVKYAALNLASIPRFGSLEFRSMKGTVDVDTVTTWVSLLNCIKNCQLNTVKEVVTFLEANGPEKLGEFVFGDLVSHIMFPSFAMNVMRAASYLVEIPHEVKLDKPAKTPVQEEEELRQAILKIKPQRANNEAIAFVQANFPPQVQF